MRWLKWLLALPLAAVVVFNAYVYGSILTYRAVAPHSTAFMQMRMGQKRRGCGGVHHVVHQLGLGQYCVCQRR